MKYLFILAFGFCSLLSGFDRVVIWGYKHHTHTHSYIHHAFFRAFKHLGYEVHWYDSRDKIDNQEFSNSLFILNQPQSDGIPIRSDCYYILHTKWAKNFNCNDTKFAPLIKEGRCILLKCFHDEFLNDPEWEKLSPCHYRNIERRELAMPWATDLLPHEIEKEKTQLTKIKPKKRIAYLGTVGSRGNGANYNQLNPFFQEGKKNGFLILRNSPWSNPLPMHRMKRIQQESLLAPAIQGEWQVNAGYIPCRIFKNISYGCLGITNSYRVWELFDRKIVYDSDTKKLFHKAVKTLENHTLEKRYTMMDYIKEHHTYLNRIKTLLELMYVCCGEETIQNVLEEALNE